MAAAFASSADVVSASTDPSSNGPQELVSLLRLYWENRDAERYRELFTEDFRFTYSGDSFDREWGRAEELAAAASLFGPGTGSQPGATSVALTLEGDWNPGSIFLAEKPYPWHQQVLVPNVSLQVTRSDGSILTAQGSTVFYLVRGDSAAIPQELRDRGFTADSTRWYVERWEDTPRSVVVDHPPVVFAPTALSVRVGSMITIDVTASDRDGDPITTLSSSEATGASFIHKLDNTAGWLTWTPGPADVGTHGLTFLASNRLPGYATSTIQVLEAPEGPVGVNSPPIASLNFSPKRGLPPLKVAFDASSSRDPDGTIVNYKFRFGDADSVSQASPVATHTYAALGQWAGAIVVTDDRGLSSVAHFLVVADAGNPPAGNPPLVTAPATVDVKVGIPVAIRVSASDPDGDPIQSLTARGPSGSNFVVAVDNRSGTLIWTPGSADLGVYTVTFTASNTLTGLAWTVITVSPPGQEPNLAPNPSFETGTQGWKSMDAVLERIPGGHSGAYALQVTGSTATQGSFGINDSPNMIDRTVGAGIRYRYAAWVRSPSAQGMAKLLMREYSLATGARLGEAISVAVRLTPDWQMLTLDYVTTAGNTTLSFQVLDYPVAASELFIVDDIGVQVVGTEGPMPNLAQNPSFETDTQGWKPYGDGVLDRIQGGHEGSYSLRVSAPAATQSRFGINDSPNMIYRTVGAGIRYRYTAWVRSPSAHGKAKLVVNENAMTTAALVGELRSAPVVLTPEWQMLTLEYVTTAENTTLSLQVRDYPVAPSEVFLIDDISVRNVAASGMGTGMAHGPRWADEDIGFEPVLAPNPMRERGWLRFGTTETGALRVDVLDVAGRRIRRLFEEWNVPAGVHELAVPSVGETGARLGAGVYFYRIEAGEGVRIGRFVVLQ